MKSDLPSKIEYDFGPENDFTPAWLAELRKESNIAIVDAYDTIDADGNTVDNGDGY